MLSLQENFEQKHDLLIEETELKQVAYIFSCNNCTLQIKGKINSIIVGELPHKSQTNVAMIPDSDITSYSFTPVRQLQEAGAGV